MGRGKFTPEEMAELSTNPYVVFVEEKQVVFSAQFKEHFMEQYDAGQGPTAIFRASGIRPELLGDKRIERAAARWKASYRSGTLGEKRASRKGPKEHHDLILEYQRLIDEKNRRIQELEALLAALENQ